jgi:hypothetical protein
MGDPRIHQIEFDDCTRPGHRNLKFNLMVSADPRTHIKVTQIEQRIGQNMKILTQREEPGGELMPVVVTLIVAVVGTAGILLNTLGPVNGSQGGGDARMITAAAVSRAGAIEIPSKPPVGRS